MRPARADARHDRREYWWLFAGRAPEIRAFLERHGRALAVAQTSPHRAFAFVSSGYTIANTLVVLLLDTWTALACLQSRVHGAWIEHQASSFKEDVRYTPSDCFETYPFPEADPRSVLQPLEGVGQRLYDTRAKYMLDESVGLTMTYNRLKDAACTDARIVELRKLHEEVDRAVLAAYAENDPGGRWSEVDVPPYCPLNDAETKKLEAFEGAVIDRLFALNAKRAEAEQLRGAAALPGSRARSNGSPRAAKEQTVAGTEQLILAGAAPSGEARPTKRKAKKTRGERG